jgi:hypothetical protein
MLAKIARANARPLCDRGDAKPQVRLCSEKGFIGSEVWANGSIKVKAKGFMNMIDNGV